MFFQIDDQFHVNPKAKALARKALKNDLHGLAALGLWTVTGSMIQAAGTDGVATLEDLVAITLNHALAIELADHLVSAGLWHQTGHECERCPVVAMDTFLYHDWFAMGYDTGEQVKITRGKRKELKDAKIVAAVWARDCIDDPASPAVGLCRYCQTEVRRQDRKSDRRPEMDHVDPTLYCGPRNIVLACLQCNRKKGQRTPEQAGMTLHPAPRAQALADDAQDVSPAPAAAETNQSPAQPYQRQQEQIRPADQTDRPSGSPVISDEKGIPVGARTGTRPGRAGEGRVPEGLSNGSLGVTPAEPNSKPSRRRRRGKGGNRNTPAAARQHPHQEQTSNTLAPKHNAGEAPDVTAPGRFGSPWHGWTGKPSTVDETTCYDHNEEQPCWKCKEENA